MQEQTDKPQMKMDAAQGTSQPSGQQRDLPANGEQNRPQPGMTRRDWFAPSAWTENPFAIMRRFSDEMDRMMDRFREDFGVGRGWLGARFGSAREFGRGLWAPQIEVCERDNQLIVCVDLPGLKKEDIQVEFSQDTLTIQGERRHDH